MKKSCSLYQEHVCLSVCPPATSYVSLSICVACGSSGPSFWAGCTTSTSRLAQPVSLEEKRDLEEGTKPVSFLRYQCLRSLPFYPGTSSIEALLQLGHLSQLGSWGPCCLRAYVHFQTGASRDGRMAEAATGVTFLLLPPRLRSFSLSFNHSRDFYFVFLIFSDPRLAHMNGKKKSLENPLLFFIRSSFEIESELPPHAHMLFQQYDVEADQNDIKQPERILICWRPSNAF